MIDNLRPCPFCGSKKLWKHPDDIECEDCNGIWPESNWNTRPIEDALVKALLLARKQIADLDDVLNQGNHLIIGWHQNGDTEPISGFFEENDCGAIEAIDAALALAKVRGNGQCR